jgi:SAM-dependent methyltransferase
MKNGLISLEMSLQWQDTHARHTARQYFSKANLWRDIFPAAMAGAFGEANVGEEIKRSIAAGELFQPYDPRQRITIQSSQFNMASGSGLKNFPRQGRFYPRNLIRGYREITADDRRPMRIVAIHDGSMEIDLNNPLTYYDVTTSARVDKVLPPLQEHGDRCNDFVYDMLQSGVGMQTSLLQGETDFFSGDPFARLDEDNDAQFYEKPRLVQHLDAVARHHIEACYGGFLQPGMRVLDLMSSWVSHIPPRRDISIVGLGMNEEELKRNAGLNKYVVHDLNKSPVLEFDNNTLDLVTCTASVEYLVKPFEVLEEIARCLRPGGELVITFSDRWFPPKAIKIWSELHPFERVALVVDYFRQSGRFENIETLSILHYPRPEDDKYSDRLVYSDPVFAVWASVRQN